ncbi:sigma-70 family RNA polymerase sigma factor [Nocardioides sp.]|uniref:sigma-70 family RNA polymerase sigma factor n=1 Tax=Nocardioides sp. TaxID=35761 RepID=UPI0035135461
MARRVPEDTVDLRREDQLCAAYRAHGDELFRLCLRSTGDRGVAADLVQEVFLRAWRAADSFDARRGSLRTWLFGIARNALVDHARRQAARPRLVPVAEDPEPDAATADGVAPEEQVMDAWVLEEALARLSPEHRRAVVEVHLRDRAPAEAAALLGVPVGTVRSRVFYGLRALRIALDEMGVEW